MPCTHHNPPKIDVADYFKEKTEKAKKKSTKLTKQWKRYNK